MAGRRVAFACRLWSGTRQACLTSGRITRQSVYLTRRHTTSATGSTAKGGLRLGIYKTWRTENDKVLRQFSTSDLPSHKKVTLPALSPTMEQGTLVSWEKEEGEHIEEGDVLAQVETDKATMEMESPSTGYIAKVFVSAGTKELPLGQLLCIITEDQKDISAFRDYQPETVSPLPTTSPQAQDTPPPSSSPPAHSVSWPQDLPSHKKVTLPALSPTMEQGTLVSWEKEEGEHIEEGDVLAQVETDKATMEMESPSTGYIAKVFVSAGTKELPLGQLLCVLVENEEDAAVFKDLQDPGTAAKPVEKQEEVKSEEPSSSITHPSAATPTQPAATPTPGSRVLASPYARALAAEKGINLSAVGSGTGYSGSITSRDLTSVPSQQTPFTDIELTGMRKTIASRLVQSKQSVPHYYLTMDINMDDIIRIRKELNSQDNVKLSINDFIIKASAFALKKVPEVNSSWMDTFIRRYSTVDISVAVSTDGGLITPIIPNVTEKGLLQISSEMRELAEKARSGKLKPEEYQGGTFTISNLGMYGIKSFTAVINPPQSCILAVGGADLRPVSNKTAEHGFVMANVMTVTMSCDHRVVDGAVGAQWLSQFKSFLENPYTMLL